MHHSSLAISRQSSCSFTRFRGWVGVAVVAGATLMGGAGTAMAELVFNLDVTRKVFFFTGSDAGTPNPGPQNGRVWWTANLEGTFPEDRSLLLGDSISATSDLSPIESSVFRASTPRPVFEIRLSPNTSARQTVRGTREEVSYSTLSQEHQIRLESFVAQGGVFVLALGGEFSPIRTTMSSGNSGPGDTVSIELAGRDRRVVSKEKVTIRGVAESDFGIARVLYKAKGAGFKRAKGTDAWKFRPSLSPGRNVFRVVAVDRRGNRSSSVKAIVIRR